MTTTRLALLSAFAAAGLACATPQEARAPQRTASGVREPDAQDAQPPASSEAYRALLESELHKEHGELTDAIQLLHEAILHDPGSVYLRVRLGEALVEAGDAEQAEQAARQALERDARNGPALRLLAAAQLLAGARGEARKTLERALHTTPGDRTTSERLAELLVEDGDVAGAEGVIERLMAAEPGAVDGYVTLARLFFSRGDVVRAATHVARAREREPRDVDALELDLALRFATGQFAQALDVARALAVEAGDSRQMRETLLVASALGANRAAAEELARAWLVDEPSADTRLFIASGFERAGLRSAARKILEDGAPRDARVTLEQARLALGDREAKRASELACPLPKAVRGLDDKTREALRAVCATALAELGRGKEATAVVVDALEKNVGSWRLWSVLSGLAEKHQLELDAPRTDALFARARAASPADITVLESGARVREARGDVAGARALLDDALRARPRDAEIELALARLLSRRGEARAAAELCERVLERTRPDVDVLNLIAFTLADAALRPDDARRFAWRAIALDPLNGSVIDTLGWAELRAGDAASAVETLARADRLDPDEPEILLHLAEAQRAMGRVDDARKSASRAQALASTDDPLRARIDALVATLGAS